MTDTMVSVQSATSVITIILGNMTVFIVINASNMGRIQVFSNRELTETQISSRDYQKGISNLVRIVNSARTAGVTVKVGRLLLSQVRLHMNCYGYILEKFKSKD